MKPQNFGQDKEYLRPPFENTNEHEKKKLVYFETFPVLFGDPPLFSNAAKMIFRRQSALIINTDNVIYMKKMKTALK